VLLAIKVKGNIGKTGMSGFRPNLDGLSVRRLRFTPLTDLLSGVSGNRSLTVFLVEA
jgi:hypothetical protein